MLFLLKKIIAGFLMPIPLIVLIYCLGLFLIWCTKKQKAGVLLVTFTFFMLCLFSFSPLPDAMLTTLERQYAAYAPSVRQDTDGQQGGIKFVVVLGGGHASDPFLPATSQISRAGLIRLVEGIRIYRQTPGSKLVLCGGSVIDPVSEAKLMAGIATDLGVNENGIILESLSKDTKDEARLIQTIVGRQPFVLVTSASHMPRSMALFRKQGMNPIPAPTGHLVQMSQATGPSRFFFFPGSGALGKTETTFYEYLGTYWAKLRGLI